MKGTHFAAGWPIERFRITDAGERGTLSAWRLCPPETSSPAPVVVYVCGATFASEQAIGFRFDGRSWADELTAAGYEVWAFDFIGYGRSDRYPEMDATPRARRSGVRPRQPTSSSESSTSSKTTAEVRGSTYWPTHGAPCRRAGSPQTTPS